MKKILYVFDDINYESGAQKATLNQIRCLADRYEIHVLTLKKPLEELKIPAALFDAEEIWDNSGLYTDSFKSVLRSNVAWNKKVLRVCYAMLVRLGMGDVFLNYILYGKLIDKMEPFDTVIVVSEASKMRTLVSKLTHPKKIQWIHTDYELWSNYTSWTKAITKNDNMLYRKFDKIIVLTEVSKAGTVRKLPGIKEKVYVIPNLINEQDILEKSQKNISIKIKEKKYRFVTVGRIDKEKNFDRVLDVCKKLKKDAVDFVWYIIGDGPLLEEIELKIKKYDLDNYVILLGRLDNPYPVMKKCNCFVLLSDYEGTPVTIDEAAVLGLPVISTNVGGIAEQVERYGNGILLRIDEDIYTKFREAMSHLDEKSLMNSVKAVNEETLEKIVEILGE